MRIRLIVAVGMVLALACGGSTAFQQGVDQALVQNLTEAEAKLQGMEPGPNRKAVLELCTRAQAEASAGKLELVQTSVWLGELEVTMQDGEISDEEVASLTASYEKMVQP